MKTLILRMCCIVTMVCCLCAISGPAFAAGNDTAGGGSYGIDITLRLDGEDAAEHEPDEYRQNTFLIQDADTGYFLVAQYNNADRCYYLTDYAVSKEEATYFTFEEEAAPEKLIVKGLPAGAYSICQEEASEGFMLHRAISVNLSDSGSKLEGDDSELNAENLMELNVNLSKGFRIPGCDRWMCWAYNTFGFNIFPVLLLVWMTLAVVEIVLCINLFKMVKKSRQKESDSK